MGRSLQSDSALEIQARQVILLRCANGPKRKAAPRVNREGIPAVLHAGASPLDRALRRRWPARPHSAPSPHLAAHRPHTRSNVRPAPFFSTPAAAAPDAAFSLPYLRCTRAPKKAASGETPATGAPRGRYPRWLPAQGGARCLLRLTRAELRQLTGAGVWHSAHATHCPPHSTTCAAASLRDTPDTSSVSSASPIP